MDESGRPEIHPLCSQSLNTVCTECDYYHIRKIPASFKTWAECTQGFWKSMKMWNRCEDDNI